MLSDLYYCTYCAHTPLDQERGAASNLYHWKCPRCGMTGAEGEEVPREQAEHIAALEQHRRERGEDHADAEAQ